MNFIDKADIVVAAGNGGNGRMSFRREKFITHGGPDGGDGGNGGNIVFVASRNQNTLSRFRFQKELHAESGGDGSQRRKHGKNGTDLFVDVPVGTLVIHTDGRIASDLTEDGQQAIIAQGGQGGFGNAHFVSSTRQAPKFAEKGEAGEAYTLKLELKMIADVGVVGLPNAGKSTLLSRISGARPEIADYPFTTLKPNIGVVDIDKHSSLLFADIPGLIEGASEGKGLGHEFLRHIERTAVILHLIDAYQNDVVKAYKTITQELRSHDPALLEHPEIVALNKVEGLDEEIVDDLMMQLRKAVPKETPLFAISAQSGTGLKELLFAVNAAVRQARLAKVKSDEGSATDIPTHTLKNATDGWTVEKQGNVFIVRGVKIERFATRTDFHNLEAIQRLRNIMQKMGIIHELNRQGIEPGDRIRLNNEEFKY